MFFKSQFLGIAFLRICYIFLRLTSSKRVTKNVEALNICLVAGCRFRLQRGYTSVYPDDFLRRPFMILKEKGNLWQPNPHWTSRRLDFMLYAGCPVLRCSMFKLQECSFGVRMNRCRSLQWFSTFIPKWKLTGYEYQRIELQSRWKVDESYPPLP